MLLLLLAVVVVVEAESSSFFSMQVVPPAVEELGNAARPLQSKNNRGLLERCAPCPSTPTVDAPRRWVGGQMVKYRASVDCCSTDRASALAIKDCTFWGENGDATMEIALLNL